MEAIAFHQPSPADSRWTAAIDRAVGEPDPAFANLLITQTHHDLGLALRACIGPDAGANFHAWATWGSREAGTTIRMADLPGLRHFAPARGALVRARDAISAGNRMVLDEIGRESARFVESEEDHRTRIAGLVDAFGATGLRCPDRAGPDVYGGRQPSPATSARSGTSTCGCSRSSPGRCRVGSDT
jgi:hypothetical protein